MEDDYDDDLERLPRNLKRLKKQVPDRISNCPDSIFLDIQSFLPMEEVIKTGILWKRWKFLWTAATTLNFNYQGWSSNYSISKFVTLIDKTLVRCSVSHVEKIAIGFPYQPRFLYDVYGWMQFANKHSINELEPKFKAPNLNVQYCLPHCVYDNYFLRKLRLSSCELSESNNIKWKHLSILSLEYMVLDEELLGNILSNCPELNVLELSICGGIKCFEIESTSLRKFVLKAYWSRFSEDNECCLEIAATNIKSLEISGFMHRKLVRIVNAPSLVDAKLEE